MKAQDVGGLERDSVVLSCSEKQLLQINEKLDQISESQEHSRASRYKLFPTSNMWTFIKLDTRKGVLTHVQFSVGDDSDNDFEYSLGSAYSRYSNVYEALTVNGRFTLYPTENMYTFIMLDQITGRTWHVQWSQNANERQVNPIYYSTVSQNHTSRGELRGDDPNVVIDNTRCRAVEFDAYYNEYLQCESKPSEEFDNGYCKEHQSYVK